MEGNTDSPPSRPNRSVAGVGSYSENDTEVSPSARLANPPHGRVHRRPLINDRIKTRREVLELTGGGRKSDEYDNTEHLRGGIIDGRSDKCLAPLI